MELSCDLSCFPGNLNLFQIQLSRSYNNLHALVSWVCLSVDIVCRQCVLFLFCQWVIMYVSHSLWKAVLYFTLSTVFSGCVSRLQVVDPVLAFYCRFFSFVFAFFQPVTSLLTLSWNVLSSAPCPILLHCFSCSFHCLAATVNETFQQYFYLSFCCSCC